MKMRWNDVRFLDFDQVTLSRGDIILRRILSTANTQEKTYNTFISCEPNVLNKYK